MRGMDKPRSYAPIIATILLLLPMLYAGSYLAPVKPEGILVGIHQATSAELLDADIYSSPSEIRFTPEHRYYRLGGQWSKRIFWPLEQIDRRLRPAAWATAGPFRSTIDSISSRSFPMGNPP
jgi:hypothetical protein